MRARGESGGTDRLEHERTALARYLFMLVASLSALLVTSALYEWDDQRPSYTPLIAAAALSAWYGGLGPGLAALAVCWLGALLTVVEPESAPLIGGEKEMVRWGVALAVALILVLTSEVLRLGRRQAVTEAAAARADLVRLASLEEVASALSAAVSSVDVSRALTTRGASLVGAQGAAVAVVDGEELVLEEPSGLAEHMWPPEGRVPRRRSTLLALAVEQGSPVVALDRADLAASFPDSAAMMPTVQAAIAVPLQAEGVPVGALGFVFEREGALGEEEVAFTTTMASLAEQALERARLYERERGTRQALDRILHVAPRFHADSSADATRAICVEARRAFGSDVAILWRVRSGDLQMIGLDPPQPELEPGETWSLTDFPDLKEAVGSLRVSFVPDVLEESRDRGLDLNRRLAVRSSLRTPIMLSGQAELVLSLGWHRVVNEPDTSTLAIVRRFADQAALALEELDRRRAERELARRVDDMHGLQSLTAALSNALTRADVATIAVEHVPFAVGADGAAVAAVAEDRQPIRLLASSGYADETVAAWEEPAVEAIEPLAPILQRSDPTLFGSRDVLRAHHPELYAELLPSGHEAFLFVPLAAGRRTHGLLVLSWLEPRIFGKDGLDYLGSMASQVAQAMDRAMHFESEQTIAETLQRSVLPASLPRVQGLQLAARYLPGSAELDVGGDWFDAMTLPDGRVGLVVGDVVGKGVFAAASMGQLRNAVRAFSVDRLKPASVLARLNRLAEEVLDTTFATLAYVVVDTESGICRIASAGHPPPIARYPDGRVEFVEGGRGLPLGTGLDMRYRQDVFDLPAGASLLLYTDGLVERRGRSIDDGLDDLAEAVRTAPSAPEAMLEHVLGHMVGEDERGDDIALLTARLLPVAPTELVLRISSDPSSLQLVRDALRIWLEGAPLERSEAEEVVLAAWEACANALEHARDPTDDVIQVRAALRGESVRIVVEDSGSWKPPTSERDRGLGLRLMRSVMSSVDVSVGDDGTRVTIEKSTAGAPTRP